MHREPSRVESSQEGNVDLLAAVRDVWLFVGRRRYWIVGGVLLGVSLALVIRFLLPSTSEVHATILVVKKDASLPAEGFEGGRDFEGRVVEDLLSTHLEILTSPRIVSRALKTHDLEALPSILAVLKPDETTVDYVLDNLSASKGGEGQAKAAHVLNVSFVHRDPHDAARILEAVIESYRQFVEEIFKEVGGEAATLISDATSQLATDLQRKQTALREHREQAPLLWSGNETLNVHQARITEFETDLALLNTRRVRITSRLQIIEKRRAAAKDELTDVECLSLIADEDMQRFALMLTSESGSSLTEVFQANQPARSQIATVEFERLATLRTEEQALRTEFGPNHRAVREKRLAIEELERLLNESAQRLGHDLEGTTKPSGMELLNAYVSLLKQDLAEIAQRQQVLNGLVADELKQAKELVSYELKDEEIRNDIAGSMEVYSAIADRLKEVNLVTNYGGFVTEVLSPVEPGPQLKASLPLAVFVGLVLGLLAGIAAALAVDVGDRSFRTPEEIRRQLALPILAHVPCMGARSSRRKKDERSNGLDVWSALRPRSREAEVFRALRTELCFGGEAGGRKVLQVTSPNPGDGKSLVAANLAVSLAQSGKNVLLADCDLRRPALHELFKVDGRHGLSTVLTGETDLPDAVQPTEIPHLSVLPSGPLPADPAELLVSPKFDQTLELIRDRYDFVLLDSAPLLSVSDPAAIAARADAVVLVLRLDRHARSSAARAQHKLESVNADVVGVVVNCLDKKSCRNYGRTSEDATEFGSVGRGRYDEYFPDEKLTSV